MKIFCCDCEYFDRGLGRRYCIHPACFVESPISPTGKRVRGSEDLNRNNDCKYFKRQPKPSLLRMILTLGMYE